MRSQGVTVTGVELAIPDTIRRKFAAGWVEHIPLTYLMDLACQKATGPKTTQDSLAFNEATGTIHAISRPLSNEGEDSLGFTDWFQAWKHLKNLIAEFLPEEHDAWTVHFDRIHLKDSILTQWNLWLTYDIKVRRRSCVSNLDPAEFHYALWNYLEPRFIAKQTEAMVHDYMHLGPSTKPPAQTSCFKREASPYPNSPNRH